MQVQRSLAAPALSKTEPEVHLQAGPAAPALPRALALVLSATESKENETEHLNTGLEENAKDKRPAGKTKIV